MVIVRAAAPLLAALLAVAAVAASGLVQRDLFGTPLEDRAYGFFFDRYPLFVFAVVYALAHVLTEGVLAPGGRRLWRGLTVPAALLLVLAAALHPTFGGLILRPGFFTGGVSFLRGASAGGAALLGAAAAGFMLALTVGLAGALARLRRPRRPRRGGVLRGLLAVPAFGVALAVLDAPRSLGVPGPGLWPAAPLAGGNAAAVAALVALAFLPHTLLVGLGAAAERGNHPP